MFGLLHRPAASLLLLALALSAGPARADKFDVSDYPAAVVCTFQDGERFFYLSKIQSGIAVYSSPDRMVATIEASGSPLTMMTTTGSGSCGGKSIKDLFDDGRAFAFPK